MNKIKANLCFTILLLEQVLSDPRGVTRGMSEWNYNNNYSSSYLNAYSMFQLFPENRKSIP